MGKSFDSKTKTIGSILGHFERRVVVVPQFQRGFSWEKAQVSTFWNDITAFNEVYIKSPKSATYFLGPIVTQDTDDEIILLDGQQRLATSIILLAAIRDIARGLPFHDNDRGRDFARDTQRTLIEKEDTDQHSLQLGELDEEFFLKTVKKDPPDNVSSKLRSHELIRTAYKLLRSNLEGFIQNRALDADSALDYLKSMKDCLVKGMDLVVINVASEDDAYSIFETLNDRGLRLTVPDLLLNLLMRRAQTDAQRQQIRSKWNTMLEDLGRRDISRFLRHMWLSRYGDLKVRSLFNELKDHLNNNRISSVDFADKCANDCEDYINLIEQDKTVPKAALDNLSGIVKYLRVTSSLPLLLSGKQCLSEADFVRLVKYVADIAVRYVLVMDLNPSTLENAFYHAAREVRIKNQLKESSAKCLQAAKVTLNDLNPDDNSVEEKVKQISLERASALWLVTQLANVQQSKTNELAMNMANLEHIFPVNAKVTDWPNRSLLEPYTWKLGNLTILGERLNSAAGNKPFTTKCTSYYSKSDIVMTKEILIYGNWTPSEVEDRGSKLAKLVVTTFPGP